MTYREWKERLDTNHAVFRNNRIYDIVFWQFSDTEIYVEQMFIKPKYRGRGYLKRIFTNLCKEYNKPLIFQCYDELVPMYEHIGAFTMTPRRYGLIEMYFDPLEVSY